ncbi:hypothetical protein [Pengzhenrongella sicca]|uniref:Uncharacterized protein n=1 Tax=Pengzhenrongella sicca TaxID=2819238 RepID=A0A8A4ZII3_9MICO|nr:hypothetical protein [Pengzhenrongella sicca]QTE30316.1 hypothetical protein J4E96_04765 [Pengzhenrongella sicca]
MSTVSSGPSDRVDDELLVLADLPAGWNPLSRSAGKRPEDDRVEFDAVLGYVDQTRTGHEPQAQRDSEQSDTAGGRWRYIQHTETKTRVYLRLHGQGAIAGEIRITGVVYLPGRPGDPITSHLLRELPTARIEAAINKRLFAATRTNAITGGEIELPSGRKVAERDLLEPLADPKQTPDFYELVALQHSRLTANGDVNPSATMAELSGVALSTTQGWVAKARTRELLPPGRRGRPG